MESPIIVDKPPEYHGNDDRGFPFEEEESAGAWSELAARHPDIAARLRAHPAAPAAGAAWARKRRPDTHEHDFGDSFGDFDRFIPSEFREHFPSSFGSRRFGRGQEEPQAHTSQPQSPPKQQTTATQTERDPPPEQTLPQYGLRNTVDLGQKSAVDPSLVDADERTQRSVSAPPESRPQHSNMSAPNHQEPEQPARPGKVRNIPIFVEGRDAPVINDTLDHGSHFGETKPTYVPQQSPPDGAYFPDETPLHFNHPPPNFTRSFATPFTKQYRQGQPFAQQKVYPQSAAAFARAASPHRSQSPKPQHDEFVNVPVHHEKPKPEPPRPQQRQQPPPPPPQPQQQPPPKQPTPPPQPKPHDPISQILEIQTNVLNLMSEVEKFTGTKKDKQYLFLDEMLTRNLISLDNIETEGKENIRNARKEAIRCIQKCIAVLEAKADGRSVSTPQPQEPAQDVEMNAEGQTEGHANEEKATENGEVEMKEGAKEEPKVDTEQPKEEEKKEPPAQPENIEAPQTDTRPEEPAPVTETKEEDKDKSKKPTKKRDKSKDKSTDAKNEAMAVDEKESKMEVDAGASQ